MLIENTRANRDAYIWDHIPDIETLTAVRMTAMNRFLDDFEEGKSQGRYRVGALPELDFQNRHFDLVLCPHSLFTYTEQLNDAFHVAAVREMVRVGRDLRIFPLLDLNGEFSRHVAPVEAALQEDGHTTERIKVDYEFQKGGNEYLRIAG
ncbi:MAG: class I SAM-dependent methyltransferase [Candidatus Hydrogenedentota bacterium]